MQRRAPLPESARSSSIANARRYSVRGAMSDCSSNSSCSSWSRRIYCCPDRLESSDSAGDRSRCHHRRHHRCLVCSGSASNANWGLVGGIATHSWPDRPFPSHSAQTPPTTVMSALCASTTAGCATQTSCIRVSIGGRQRRSDAGPVAMPTGLACFRRPRLWRCLGLIGERGRRRGHRYKPTAHFF